VSATVPNYRWSVSEFVRAWDAGAFDHRVELIEGELWPVVIGDWHGAMVTRLIRRLPEAGAIITASTLPSGDSLPDPDCWVRRSGTAPVDHLGLRLSRWAPSDVLLVVEVSDDTVLADLTTKARIYGSAGYPVYWVVAADVIYEHTEPLAGGYRQRREYRAGDRLPVAYAGVELDVEDLLAVVV
jgi:hypothetical protein